MAIHNIENSFSECTVDVQKPFPLNRSLPDETDWPYCFSHKPRHSHSAYLLFSFSTPKISSIFQVWIQSLIKKPISIFFYLSPSRNLYLGSGSLCVMFSYRMNFWEKNIEISYTMKKNKLLLVTLDAEIGFLFDL